MSKRSTAALVSFVLLAAAVALAQVDQRTLDVHFSGGSADVSYSVADFADAAVRRRLSTGVTQVLVVRTYAYEAGSTAPIAVAVRSCRVTFDPWPENFRVHEQSESVDRTVELATLEEVVQRCLVADHVHVGGAASWDDHHGNRITFGVVVELNPLTPDAVQRIRRWLARPEGGASPDDAFFGSFVSLFVNRGIGEAERTLSFRSQDITCP
jgi:hypothetical protein